MVSAADGALLDHLEEKSCNETKEAKKTTTKKQDVI